MSVLARWQIAVGDWVALMVLWPLCRLISWCRLSYLLMSHGPRWLWRLYILRVIGPIWWADERRQLRAAGLPLENPQMELE